LSSSSVAAEVTFSYSSRLYGFPGRAADILQEIKRHRATQPVHPYPKPPLPLIVGVLVGQPSGERNHGVRQAEHEHGDDPAHLVGPAVVIFHSDNQQASVDSKGREVLGQFSVEGAFAGRKLLLEIHPM
jgi:hypothetical protein